MPADVLEKPTAVEDAWRGISSMSSGVAVHVAAPTSAQLASETDEPNPTNQQIESVLRKIFEDYEEFLGCTPNQFGAGN